MNLSNPITSAQLSKTFNPTISPGLPVGQGLGRDENESFCQNRNFGFCLRTTGNTGIPVKTARKKAERILFSAFISESENKILTLFQKGEFNILLSLSEINAEKQILSAFFLAVLTGMPVFPVVQRRKPKFRFLHKLSFSSLLNP